MKRSKGMTLELVEYCRQKAPKGCVELKDKVYWQRLTSIMPSAFVLNWDGARVTIRASGHVTVEFVRLRPKKTFVTKLINFANDVEEFIG